MQMLTALAASQPSGNVMGASWILLVVAAVLTTAAGVGPFQRSTKLKLVAGAVALIAVMVALIATS